MKTIHERKLPVITPAEKTKLAKQKDWIHILIGIAVVEAIIINILLWIIGGL